ncbi:MAG: hypothetical protein JO116_16690 [Planctomycetaceae bacterium]|nr:hypothetical protein [Planctomycetaceae bacterium]
MRRTRRDGPGPRQRRVGRDRLPTRNSAGASTTSPWRLPRLIYRRAYGLASDLAEAHSHRLAGRLHDAPGAGGDAAEVLAEVRRRLAVGPEHDELVAEAVADARAGRRPRW